MAKFVTLWKYTGAIAGGGPERFAKVQEITKQFGGSVEHVYGLLGQYDVLSVSEFPDIAKAMEASAKVGKLIGASSNTMAAVERDVFIQMLGRI